MQNIERFNLYTVHILSRLYAEFPVRKEIPAEEVVEALRSVIPFDGADGKRELTQFVQYTLIWLIDTDYLLASGEIPRRLVLAPKAFEVLAAELPKSLRQKSDEEAKSLGEKFTDVSKELGSTIASEAKKQIASQLVGQVIGNAMKAFTS
jgi:hypothetical protein